MNAMLDAFLNTLQRLEAMIDIETAALQANHPVDLNDFNQKKRHGVLELSRSMRVLDGEALECAKEPLTRLRGKVERNLSVLEIHMKAVHEVAATIAAAIQEHESDGTYSRWLPAPGNSRC